MNKISSCDVAVISNRTVSDVCDFKPAVFGEAEMLSVFK